MNRIAPECARAHGASRLHRPARDPFFEVTAEIFPNRLRTRVDAAGVMPGIPHRSRRRLCRTDLDDVMDRKGRWWPALRTCALNDGDCPARSVSAVVARVRVNRLCAPALARSWTRATYPRGQAMRRQPILHLVLVAVNPQPQRSLRSVVPAEIAACACAQNAKVHSQIGTAAVQRVRRPTRAAAANGVGTVAGVRADVTGLPRMPSSIAAICAQPFVAEVRAPGRLRHVERAGVRFTAARSCA